MQSEIVEKHSVAAAASGSTDLQDDVLKIEEEKGADFLSPEAVQEEPPHYGGYVRFSIGKDEINLSNTRNKREEWKQSDTEDVNDSLYFSTMDQQSIMMPTPDIATPT